ncbi:DUF1852 domain-containing protein [Conservatibacter flavescens]|uniref:DUF1852 domain-containing protein n=1 Tax=Conservatibacter flavescens TaxID=28161 RepID=A0A2M8S5Z2_9PAST|nr:DUF1852 domain-containing protein [Conservatibacter flavescens]PJG86531.1 DUF1852 domain-containing protein [Conservatibacter flavescens]
MTTPFRCSIKTLRFDENYEPAQSTRLTTNFANLARGERRQENLKNTINMINKRFNDLANWDNPTSDRYSIELDIVSIDMQVQGDADIFPAIEVLKTYIIDHKTGQRLDGIVGNNFSSYVRDYDFSVLLAEYNKNKSEFSVPDNYGELHGKLYQYLVSSDEYKALSPKAPVICLSVATTRTYHRTDNHHPILGVEYIQNDYSLTDEYFKKMGLSVRYFMPPKSVAPYAFYFKGDLLNDYTNLELIGTISTMETFQKIYRPEIYNANSAAGKTYQPSLNYEDYSVTKIEYDREERRLLAIKQGEFTKEHFINRHRDLLAQWANTDVL